MSLSCQYQEIKQGQTSGYFITGTNTFYEQPLQFVDFSPSPTIGFAVQNITDHDINARIFYTHHSTASNVTYCVGEFNHNQEVLVPANNKISINVCIDCKCGGGAINTSYVILSNNLIKSTKSYDYNICRKCPSNGDTNCLNDGNSCNNKNQCGGGFCIRGKCNNENVCYGSPSDCNCNKLTETQCPDVSICVLKNSLIIGDKPICSKLECDTNYVDKNSGLCSENPLTKSEKKEMENRNSFFINVAFGFLFFGIIIWVLFKFWETNKELENEIEISKGKIGIRKEELVIKRQELKNKKELEELGLIKKSEIEKLELEIKDKEIGLEKEREITTQMELIAKYTTEINNSEKIIKQLKEQRGKIENEKELNAKVEKELSEQIEKVHKANNNLKNAKAIHNKLKVEMEEWTKNKKSIKHIDY
ncbi:MAG: hypothetical protein WC755_08095 [Candidatus Woesearchaeota archaeon]